MSLSAELSKYRIPGPQEAYYIPEFITEEEEAYLIRKISESPQAKWKQLANRRLQIWGGEVTAKNVLLMQAMPPFINSYPNLISRLQSTCAFASSPHSAPNHVILNEYLPGQGIMPHEDGPSYHPVVATLSLGSHAVFHYYQYKPTDAPPDSLGGRSIDPVPMLSVLLERRSAVITMSTLYTSHLHGIDAVQDDHFSPQTDGQPRVRIANTHMLSEEARRVVEEGGVLKRQTRYSLTCRDVARTAGMKSFTRR